MSMTRQPFSRKLGALLLLCACACAWGCTNNKPIGYSDFDPETDFSSYQTFSWITKNPLVVTGANLGNPALQGILMDEVKTYLTKRGYRYVSRKADADFVIGFAVGRQDTLTSTVYTGTYRHDYIFGRIKGVAVRTQDSSEGGIVIDIFDESSAQKKWMGWALQELTMNDLIDLQSTVRGLVTIILEHYPPT
jgi:hypothetical protein